MRRNSTGHRLDQDHHNAKEDDHTVWLARQLHAEGLGYGAIGKKLEVPWPTVRDWIKGRTRG